MFMLLPVPAANTANVLDAQCSQAVRPQVSPPAKVNVPWTSMACGPSLEEPRAADIKLQSAPAYPDLQGKLHDLGLALPLLRRLR